MGRPTGRPRGPGRPRGSGRTAGRPPGRPRRSSNSTVASIDRSHIKYEPESSVLKPTKTLESDEWPCFVLKDAVVYRKTADGQLEIANVCNVDLEGPFIVRGKLDADDADSEEHGQYLRNNDTNKSSYLEISSSVMYSIGYGPWPAVWVSGKAGWFEINPAPEYEAMYELVCEGITLYYSLMVAYEDRLRKLAKAKRAKAMQTKIHDLLFKYAVSVGDGVTLSEAKERCQKHAPFLLAHFSKELAFNWNATSFIKWLSTENESLMQKLADAANKRPLQPAAKQPSPQSDIVKTKIEPRNEITQPSLRASPSEPDRSRRSKSRASRKSQEDDVEMKDAEPVQPPRRTETPIRPPLPGQIPSVPGAKAFIPTASIGPPRVQAANTPANARTGEPAQDPIRFLRDLLEEILDELDGDTSRVKEGTVHSRMYMKCSVQYAACKEVTHFYAKALAASLPSKWYGSPFFLYLQEQRNKPWQPEHLTSDTVALQLVRRKKNKPTGIPRNRNARFDLLLGRGQGAGKHFPGTPRFLSALRPGPSAKRPMSYDDEDDEGRPSKLSRTSRDSDSDESDNSDDEEIDDSSDHAAATPSGTNTTPLPTAPSETVRIVVRAERIPTMSPSGLNGTWKCEEEGCNYIVRSAEEPEGKALIEQHFQEHMDRVTKISLALAEGTRGHLPINHLLEKIRSIGESAAQREEHSLDSKKFPSPIKRRLLV